MKISLCLLATRKYKQFVQPLLEDVKKFFLPNHKIEVTVFIDELQTFFGDDRVSVVQELIPSYKYPEITLHRYRILTSKTYDADYIFYTDVDMGIIDTVDDSFLGNVVAVRHPGFDKMGGGSWGNDKKSTSYTHPEFRTSYYAGGVQGGRTEYYFPIMQRIKRDIDEDEKNGVLAEWHDETHWNRFLSEYKSFTEHDSSFCMVEQPELRSKWNIDGLSPKIIALAKNHTEIRS